MCRAMLVRDCRVKESMLAISRIFAISVNYIYFLLSGSKYLSCASIENITRMSL